MPTLGRVYAVEANAFAVDLDGVAVNHYGAHLKVGLDPAEDERMISDIRSAIGPNGKLRIDANEAWSTLQAAKLIPALG